MPRLVHLCVLFVYFKRYITTNSKLNNLDTNIRDSLWELFFIYLLQMHRTMYLGNTYKSYRAETILLHFNTLAGSDYITPFKGIESTVSNSGSVTVVLKW